MVASKHDLKWGHEDVEFLLDNGIAVRARGVEAARVGEKAEVYFDPLSALAQYYSWLAKEAGLEEPRDAALLSILAAPIGGIQVPWILRKYTLNKMLFYQWMRAEAMGLGKAFPHDEFVAERKGPIPTHIEEDLLRLERSGLLKITRHDPKAKEHQPWRIELTDAGRQKARDFFGPTETWFRRITIDTKRDLFMLDPGKLRERVHSEYPKYRRKYAEVDDG